MPLDPNIIMATGDINNPQRFLQTVQQGAQTKQTLLQGQAMQRLRDLAANTDMTTPEGQQALIKGYAQVDPMGAIGAQTKMALTQQELAKAQSDAATAALTQKKAQIEGLDSFRQSQAGIMLAAKQRLASIQDPTQQQAILQQMNDALDKNAQQRGYFDPNHPAAQGEAWDMNKLDQKIQENMGIGQQLVEAHKQVEDQLKQDQQKETARHNLRQESIESYKATHPPAVLALGAFGGMNPGGTNNQDPLASMSQGMRAMVMGIVNGRQTMPTGRALTTPAGQAIANAVYSVDPNWSEQRAAIRKSMTTGKDGDNIGALNTATVHLDAYLEAAQALKNGDFQPGNATYNKVSSILGAPAPTTLDAIKNAVTGEQANALKGNATDVEIHNISKAFSNANSPDQFMAVGKASLGVMRQKLNTYQERYSQQIPDDKTWSPVLPSAKSVFDKYGIAGAGAPSTSPTITNQKDYDALPKGADYVDINGTPHKKGGA